MNGSKAAIYFYLKSEYAADEDRWFSVKRVASVVDLSINRTGCYLRLLVLSNCLDTKIDRFSNVYRYKRRGNNGEAL